jgi:hypothetical protein
LVRFRLTHSMRPEYRPADAGHGSAGTLAAFLLAQRSRRSATKRSHAESPPGRRDRLMRRRPSSIAASRRACGSTDAGTCGMMPPPTTWRRTCCC